MCGTAKAIEKGVSDLGKNIESNIRNVGQGVALMMQGDFTNADRTLLDLVALSSTGGLYNPDDVTNATGKQTAVARKQDEALAQAKQDEIDAINAEQEALNKSISTFLRSNVAARKLAPGAGQTLLFMPSQGSLLTPMKGS